MNLALWITAGLLAVIFLTAGGAKLIMSKEGLAAFPGGGWVDDFSAGSVKTIGALEVLAAVGLMLPARWTSRRFWRRWRPSAWCW